MKPKARRKARQLALQAVYQWQMTAAEFYPLLMQFKSQEKMASADSDYFEQLLQGVINHITDLDEQIKPNLDRPIEELNPIEIAVLRLATYELIHCLDVPYKVVINEAIDLTKTYGSQEGYKYVNGVLDKMAAQIRSAEMN